MNNEKIGGGEISPEMIVSGPEVGEVRKPVENAVEAKSGEKDFRGVEIGEGMPMDTMMPPEMPGLESQDDGKTQEEKNPEVAVDGHKIEKEWVAQTKKVLDETKGDPREKETEVNKLKADYLLKRFNRRSGDRN